MEKKVDRLKQTPGFCFNSQNTYPWRHQTSCIFMNSFEVYYAYWVQFLGQ